MAAPTVQDIVKAAITELSQVPGLATQIYATPRLQQFVQNALLLEVSRDVVAHADAVSAGCS